MRLVTFNVWFGERGFAVRAGAMLELLGAADADVIGLQEVTPSFLEHLRAAPWSRRYAISARDDLSVSPYGTIVMSRLPVRRFEHAPLWSYQGRHLELAVLDADLAVGSVHLESGRASSDVRQTQMDDVFAALSRESHAVLMGDFNFAPDWPEQSHIPAGWLDVWPQLHPLSDGFTYDTEANEMCGADRGKHRRVRFDRIVMRSDAWMPERVDRLGLQSIPGHDDLWPSDHFGLVADLRRAD